MNGTDEGFSEFRKSRRPINPVIKFKFDIFLEKTHEPVNLSENTLLSFLDILFASDNLNLCIQHNNLIPNSLIPT